MGGVLKNTFIVGATQVTNGSISEVKLAAEACSAAKMKKEGTATHVLTSNGAGAVPSYQVIPAAATGDLAKIEVLTLGGDATSLTSAAITASTYSGFVVYYRILNAGAGISGVGLRINADTGANQYLCNTMDRASSTIAAADRSLTYFEIQGSANPSASDTLTGVIHITNLASGYRAIEHAGSVQATTPSMRQAVSSNGFWKSTTEISTIGLCCATGNMAAGTTFTIWGLKK